MEASAPVLALDRKMLLTVARKLRAGHCKETGREVVVWAEVPVEERKLWIRLATRAAKMILAASPEAVARAAETSTTEPSAFELAQGPNKDEAAVD